MGASRTPRTSSRSATLGPIDPGILYPLEDFRRRTGWGRHALRAARQAGLKVHYSGNRAYVLGRDFIAHVVGDTDAVGA